MKVNMQSVNFTVDRKLVDFIQRKMDKLETYYDKIIDADIYLKVENTSAKENKIAEVRVNIPGDDIMVKKQCRTFEEAIDEATSTLQRALLKRKEKVNAPYSREEEKWCRYWMGERERDTFWLAAY